MTVVQTPQWRELTARLREAQDLKIASEILSWDQSTYMPPGGASARGRQLATLKRLAHEKFTDPAVGRLLDALDALAADLHYDSNAAALLRHTRRNYERATRVPTSFSAQLAEHCSATFTAWSYARPANDFAAVQPLLEKTLAFSHQYADFFPGYAHIADPLIAESDYGMTVAMIRPLFNQLREALTPLVQQVCDQESPDDSFLHQTYPAATQLAFGEQIIRDFGYDFARGRQDLSAHPFSTSFSRGDARITTRVYLDDLSQALFSTLHEAGHAMYEQGIDPELEGTPLAEGTSAGIHESQSRLWENLVGRSQAMWEHYYAQLQRAFPDQLGTVAVRDFYRAINKVQRSLIRTDADELTYNLHVIIRFELELALLEGTLTVADLPAAWRAAYAENLGITPPDDRDGVLQDVHWFDGFIGGAFQGYALGNILSAQFYDAATGAQPTIPQEVGTGQFETLHTWLRDNVYRHGSKFTGAELVQRVTGAPLRMEPYLDYLRSKYRGLYALS